VVSERLPEPDGTAQAPALGQIRLHYKRIGSTNARAREMAAGGVPHGALVTAEEQTVGHGRQGRPWSSPPGTSLSMSLVVRDLSPLLSLAAGVAVAETVDAILAGGLAAVAPAGATASNPVPRSSRVQIKWPNDVLLDDRKVAGILVESVPQQHWAVLGIGVNVAIPEDAFPPEIRDLAATLGLPKSAIEPVLKLLLAALERVLAAPGAEIVETVRARDALAARPIRWDAGAEHGTGAGIDDRGCLLVRRDDDTLLALDAGEVHLQRPQ
jgi:BirA family biotin operon repressor/biotin-[acetyl-CoA-carboxylase] ligase